MKDIWNAIKSIFTHDAHGIVSDRGKALLSDQQKYTYLNNLNENVKKEIKEFETVYNEVEIGKVESMPVSNQSDVVPHRDATIIQQELLEFRFSGEFVIGGIKHKLVYEPSGLEALFGAKERYTSQAFYNSTRFTHHIFDADNETIGAAMRKAYDSFYKSVEDWKKHKG